MSITVVGSSTSGAAYDQPCTTPAGTAQWDFLVATAIVYSDSASRSTLSGTGWERFALAVNTSTDFREVVEIFGKWVKKGEEAEVYTQTVSGSGNGTLLLMTSYRGVSRVKPVQQVQEFETPNASIDPVVVPAVTSLAAGSRVYAGSATWTDGMPVLAPLTQTEVAGDVDDGQQWDAAAAAGSVGPFVGAPTIAYETVTVCVALLNPSSLDPAPLYRMAA